MATPFFRGQNALDWLYALGIQTAYDWSGPMLATEFADLWDLQEATEYASEPQLFPACLVCVCQDFVFVICKSTHPVTQWFGNVLGSAAEVVPPAGGEVSVYFGASAQSRYASMKASVVAACKSRKLVLIGFSLGGAVVTILSDMFKRDAGLASATIAFGSPRPGTDNFVAGFDNSNYSHVTVDGDPVPSVPPSTWSGMGFHNVWTAFPPFVTYAHPLPGYTLQAPDKITPGESFLSLPDLIFQFDIRSWELFHDQAVYAPILRRNLPDELTDGEQGFPQASALDCLLQKAFFYSSRGWPWCKATDMTPTQEDHGMAVQLVLGIRDNSGIPLGFKEVYYLQGTDPSIAVPSISTRTSSFFALRARFLSQKCEIYYARCSAVNMGSPFVRKSYLYKYTDKPIQGLALDHATIDDAIAFDAWTADRTVRRSFHWRGIQENWFDGDKLSALGQTAVANPGPIFSFIAALRAINMCSLSGNGSDTRGQVLSAAQAVQGQPITVTCSVGFPGFALNGELIEIRGCRSAPLLNGRWQAVSQAGGDNVLLLQGSQRITAPPSTNAQIRLVQNVDTDLLTVFQFSDVTSKKTGKPDFLQRGRRSVQLRHR